ncbi:sensor histidine kinase [Nocardia sp. NPDC059240]|uniref:sensor histidine kinase n=1 Tax=Nocardia sp. NPDC059240 TaxID=3346786 RepID=UPI0036AB9C7B
MSESVSPASGEKQTVRTQRPPFPIGVLAGSLAITAAVVAAAVFFAPNDFRIPLAVGAGAAALLLSAAITVTAHYRARLGQIRQEVLAHRMQAEAQVNTTVSTAQARIAESENRIAGLREQIAEQTRTTKETEHRRAAALAAFAGAAGRMQAMSTSMLAELREMEHRHADPKVLADLLELDHRTAQAGRLADSIAVLSGARSGRRWAKPIAMESILRGAMGRVAGYQRVRLRAVTEIAIAGHAAEGIMHALAELLDNACNFSPPTTEVHVYAAEVPAGVVITIEDSGLVMSESALRRAESAVSRPRGDSDLSSLSGTRLGLAVVGHLARKHDLTVSYRPSAIGGTAVVVVVPRELITRLDRQSGTLSRLTPVTTGEHPVYTAPSDSALQPAAPKTGINPVPASSAPAPAASSDVRMTEVAALMRGADEARAATAEAQTSAAEADDTRANRADNGIAWAGIDSDRHADSTAGPEHAKEPVSDLGSQPVTAGGLPKRRRGTTLAAVHPDGLAALRPNAPTSATPPPAPRPPSAPSSMAAFQRAVSGRGDAPAALTNLGATPHALSRWLTAPDEQDGQDGPGPEPLGSPVLDALRRSDRRRDILSGTRPYEPAPQPSAPGRGSDREAADRPAVGDVMPRVDLPRDGTLAPPPFPVRSTHEDVDSTATLLPSSLTEPFRGERTGATVSSTGPAAAAPPAAAPADGESGREYGTGSFPAPPTSWETDR